MYNLYTTFLWISDVGFSYNGLEKIFFVFGYSKKIWGNIFYIIVLKTKAWKKQVNIISNI